MKSPRRPCASCPWRRDADAGDIPNFDLGLAEKLADTCPDHRDVGLTALTRPGTPSRAA